MRKIVFILTIFACVSKLFGFCREIIMSYFYGTSNIVDSYLMAGSAANIFIGWLTIFAVIHTPIYQEIKQQKGVNKAEQFTNQIVIIEIAIGILLLAIIYFLKDKIIRIIAVGFSTGMLNITSIFFSWSVLALIISSIAQVYISEMNCKQAYIRANITNIVLSIVQIIIIFISGYLDSFILLKYATPISSAIQLIIIISILSPKKRTYKTGKIFKNELGKFFCLIIPVFISAMMDDLNAFVDKMFGSTLSEGSIAALNYAHLLKQLFFYVFATAMVTVIYPKFSESIVKNDKKTFYKDFNNAMEYMLIIFSLVMFMLIAFAKPITEIVYMRGEFGEKSVLLTSQSLVMYATALLPLAMREVLVRAFQAMQNTKINMFVGMLSVFINIGFNFCLVKSLGHMGLALSTSIAAYITVPILLFLLFKNVQGGNIKYLLMLLLKTLISAFMATSLVYLLFYRCIQNIEIQYQKFGILFMAIIIGGGVYLLILHLMKVKVINKFMTNIWSRNTQ